MKHFNKFFGGMSLLIGLFMVFGAGVSAGKHWYMDMTSNLLFSVIWFGIAGFMAWDIVDNYITKRERERISKADGLLEEMMGIIKKSSLGGMPTGQEKAMVDRGVAIAKEVLGGQKRAATPDEIEKIQAQFADEFGDGWRLIVHGTSKEGIDMEVTNAPVDYVPGRSAAHDAARKRGDEARRKKNGGNMDGINPPSKKK